MPSINSAEDVVYNGHTIMGAYYNGELVWPSGGSADPPLSNAPITLSAAPLSAPVFPITKASNNRGFVDANGNPFYGIADTAWQAVSRMTQAEFTEYVMTRRSQGYTSVLISVLDIRSRTRAQDASGQTPFTATGNSASLASPLTSGSYSYWDHLEWVVDECAAHGMLAVLVPCWYGGWGDMWRGHIAATASDTSIATSYGTFLASLVGNRTNVWWLLGGDDGPTTDGNNVSGVPSGLPKVDVTAATNAMATALKSGATVTQLMTYHTLRNDTAWTYFGTESWYDMHAAYADQNTAFRVTNEWQRGTMKPVFMVEAYYDMRQEAGLSAPYLSRLEERAEAWQSMLSGALMTANGNEIVWAVKGQYGSFTWEDGIDSPSANDLRIQSRVFATWPNKQFVADHASPLISSGRMSGTSVAAGLISTDGKAAVVYFPSSRAATLNLSGFSSTPALAWVHPETGAVTQISGTTTSGSFVLTYPAGWSDAILVAMAQ